MRRYCVRQYVELISCQTVAHARAKATDQRVRLTQLCPRVFIQEPNKLQMAAVSAILVDPPRNVHAISERQSGRTLAFCIGLAARVIQSYGNGDARHIQVCCWRKANRSYALLIF